MAANTTFAAQQVSPEVGHQIWANKSPVVPQQGEIHTNIGRVPANQVTSSVTISSVFRVPHQPPTWKVN